MARMLAHLRAKAVMAADNISMEKIIVWETSTSGEKNLQHFTEVETGSQRLENIILGISTLNRCSK